MNKFINRILVLLVFNVCVASSCNKNNDSFDSKETAPLSIEFDNIIGGQNLQLQTGNYVNANNEAFTVSQLQYYVSNISLTKSDGTVYVVPQDSSYFLIREGEPSSRFARVMVPEDEYTALSFVLGVDSLRATMDLSKRKGVLDIAGGMEDGMYWGWTMGYIFFKMEGTSPHAPVDPVGIRKYRYHIGGFGNPEGPGVNNIKTISIDLKAGGVAKVRRGRKSNIHLLVDVAKVFDGTNKVSIATHPSVMFSTFSRGIADNFYEMFRHDHTEN